MYPLAVPNDRGVATMTTTTHISLGAHVWEMVPDGAVHEGRHGTVVDYWEGNGKTDEVEVWLLPEVPHPKEGEYYRYTPSLTKETLRVADLDPARTIPATHATRLDFCHRVEFWCAHTAAPATVTAAYTRTALEILGAG
jgi:hypothetical protein